MSKIELKPCPFCGSDDADECERADVDGVIDWAARIRKAVGE